MSERSRDGRGHECQCQQSEGLANHLTLLCPATALCGRFARENAADRLQVADSRQTRLGGKMEFRILGPLEVLDGDRALELTGQRQRSLLALLLLHANQVVSPGRLI